MGFSREQWRSKFVEYYEANAPEKVHMVSDTLMDKWSGKYDDLYNGMIAKYGPIGFPTEQRCTTGKRMPKAKAKGAMQASGKASVADLHDVFIRLVADSTPALEVAPRSHSMIDAKAGNSTNGLETSTFTLCTRIRPTLPNEQGMGGEMFTCIVPGPTSVAGDERTETVLILTPKLSMVGDPTLEPTSFAFDYTFGGESTNDQVYAAVGAPLVRRAMAGSVGVVFAYGQTGSGKTHTMNGLMDGCISQIYSENSSGGKRQVTFSYIEVQGQKINDCLAGVQEKGRDQGSTAEGVVQIGEGLDGGVMCRNLSEHIATDRSGLEKLVAVAQSHRNTASTERNEGSSRSHGIAILDIGQAGSGSDNASIDSDVPSPSPGRLYIIDLAGSERAADSKEHTKQRMEETKQINLSLMSLKECIRARTKASCPGGGLTVHVPYRRSKLTLLMKDVFDIGCARLCSTVVIAAVSPLARDVAHSTNTLQYAAPLRVALGKQTKIELDSRDPAFWTDEQIGEWLCSKTAESLTSACFDAKAFVAGMSGVQVCMLTEAEVFKRVQSQVPGSAGASLAKDLYSALWTLIVDAKTRKRNAKGKIITEEEEAKAQLASQAEFEAKKELWKSREAHLSSELSFNDQGLSTG